MGTCCGQWLQRGPPRNEVTEVEMASQGSSVGDLDMIDESDCNIYDDYNATHHYIDQKQQKDLFT